MEIKQLRQEEYSEARKKAMAEIAEKEKDMPVEQKVQATMTKSRKGSKSAFIKENIGRPEAEILSMMKERYPDIVDKNALNQIRFFKKKFG